MASLAIPSAQTIKRWIDYWLKFKGKRVRIFLRSGFKTIANSQIVESDKFTMGSSLEELTPDVVIGEISDIVESPFGILLKKIAIPQEEEVESVFIPMSEITQINFYKKKK